MRTWTIASFLICVLVLPAQAQEFGRVVEAEGVAYYRFTEPGQPTVRVLVMGAEAPGIYELGAETKLDELLAITGGGGIASPTIHSTVRLYREEGARRNLIYESPLRDMLTEPNEYPRLQEGDVLVVETVERRRLSWQDGITILSGLSSVVLIAFQLFGN